MGAKDWIVPQPLILLDSSFGGPEEHGSTGSRPYCSFSACLGRAKEILSKMKMVAGPTGHGCRSWLQSQKRNQQQPAVERTQYLPIC